MRRRHFIQALAAGSASPALAAEPPSAGTPAPSPRHEPTERGTFALDAQRVRFFSKHVATPFRILMVADTHRFLDDARGEPYRDEFLSESASRKGA